MFPIRRPPSGHDRYYRIKNDVGVGRAIVVYVELHLMHRITDRESRPELDRLLVISVLPRSFRWLSTSNNNSPPPTVNANAPHHLLEILEDRYGNRSPLVTSLLPTASWHALIGENAYADTILDRLVHNAHRITLEGETQRHTHPKLA